MHEQIGISAERSILPARTAYNTDLPLPHSSDWCHRHIIFNVQLTLKQYGFEEHRSTYTQMFFNSKYDTRTLSSADAEPKTRRNQTANAVGRPWFDWLIYAALGITCDAWDLLVAACVLLSLGMWTLSRCMHVGSISPWIGREPDYEGS